MNAYLLCAAAYVAGSIPFGMVLARAKGIDLRQIGSGNIGATNVARAMGKGWAIAVLAADACKGFVPVWLGRHFGLSSTVIALAGAAAIIGHMFTVFLRGRGGKGVATSLGVALALSPVSALIGFGAYVVVFATTRLSSLGSLLGIWTFALLFVLRDQPPRSLMGLALGAVSLVTLRHWENIGRLIRGEEKRT